MKILLVEDDFKVGKFLTKGLSEVSYEVKWVRSIADAEDAFCDDVYDVVVLDLTLPDGDGLDLLRSLRANASNEPVLILSARDSVTDRISGLNIGADDYLPKPFSFEELLARLRSLMRRNAVDKKTILTHREIQMDLLSRKVTFEGNEIELTRREYALLEVLLQNRGRTLTRTQIGEKVWDAHYDMQTNLIDVYVRKLRKYFEKEGDIPLIKTIRGVGYSLQ
jgi:DNA-binding response OmpR family regulator